MPPSLPDHHHLHTRQQPLPSNRGRDRIGHHMKWEDQTRCPVESQHKHWIRQIPLNPEGVRTLNVDSWPLCHTAVKFVLFWVLFCLVTSCFILKINSPLVSDHLPFLLCHQSDCLPWFLIVSTCSPLPTHVSYSLRLPLSCARVFRSFRSPQPFATAQVLSRHQVLYSFPPGEWFLVHSFHSLYLVP